jgi:hypothetical protein
MTTTTGELNQIADGLGRLVRAGQSDIGEIVSISVGAYYVQLLFNHDVLYAEAVSNVYLKGPERLSAEQERRLLALEWTKPSVPCDPRCRRDHPNFHRLWQRKTPWPDVVRDVVMTRVPAGPQPTGAARRAGGN